FKKKTYWGRGRRRERDSTPKLATVQQPSELVPFARLKSWQVQKLMPNSISAVSKNISTHTLTGRMNCVLAT
uniref:Uncharacterized protein n=1 Tax=Ursus maritimus TaxID=29073 RepID=A0A452TSI4_URSMA